MPLDPAVAALLEQMNDPNAPAMSELTPNEARAGFAQLAVLQGEPESVASVEDRRVPGPAGEIPVRIYKPSNAANLPVLVYFHGGGWVLMDVETHDPLCRALANAAGCAVVSVDYRLAPEAKYPAASDDCYAATKWVADNAAALGVDAGRIALGGDSAGGHLTAVVAQMARDRGGPALVFQVLHCPVTNFDYSTGSYRDNAEGYMLTRDSMEWFWNHYLVSPDQGAEAAASPLRGDTSNLPPALVQTAEFDPLRDEGKAYADKLKASGVPVTYHNYEGVTHDPFLFFGVVAQGRQNIDEAAEHLRRAFAK
ncbi:MAG: alpha/beta hydrolase [Chloroflexi bacterium]|nr:alpha/beta hydrolase [Chloroflexota bacterium]